MRHRRVYTTTEFPVSPPRALLLACPRAAPRGGARARPGARAAARLRVRGRRARRRRGRRGAGAVRRLAAAGRRRLARHVLARVALDHGRRDEPEPRRDGDRRLRRRVGDPGQRVRGPGRDRRRDVPGGDEPVGAAGGDRRPVAGLPAGGDVLRGDRAVGARARDGGDLRQAQARPHLRRRATRRRGATTPTTCGRRACPRATSRRTARRCRRARTTATRCTTAPSWTRCMRTVREGVRGDGKTFTGGGARPSLTFVNFPGVDSAGHGAGRGPAYDTAVGAADGEIERFVAQQKQLGLWGRSVIVLLSDHSMETTPQKSSLTARFTAAGISVGRLRDRAERLGGVRLRGDAATPGASPLLKRLRAAALGDSAAPLAGPPAVEALYREPNPEDGGSAHTLGAMHPAWRLGGDRTRRPRGHRARAGRRVQRAEPADRQPRRAADARQLLRRHRRRGAGAAAGDRGRGRSAASTTPSATRGRRRTSTWRRRSRGCSACGRRRRARGASSPRRSTVGLLPPAASGGGGGARVRSARRASGSASVRPSGRGLRFAFARRGRGGVTADVFQASIGRRMLGNRRIAHFSGRRKAFRWAGRRARDGQLFARLRVVGPDGRADVRRFALARRGGRFARRPAFYRRASCGAISSFKLERPVFGGRSNAEVDVTYRLAARGRTTLELLRGSRRVRRLAPTRVRAGEPGAPRPDRRGGPAPRRLPGAADGAGRREDDEGGLDREEAVKGALVDRPHRARRGRGVARLRRHRRVPRPGRRRGRRGAGRLRGRLRDGAARPTPASCARPRCRGGGACASASRAG